MNDNSLSQQLRQIATKLDKVLQGDYQPFGVQRHQFQLNPPLNEQEVSSFEQLYNITLPAAYRAFIIEIANGGAGPAYGMFSLFQALDRHNTVIPNDLLQTPFIHFQAYNPADDPNSIEFWQHVDNGEISQAEGDRRFLYETAGTLSLCNEGCGYYHMLVVNGPDLGQMWLDGRCSSQGFFPLGVSFLDWYERWLDSTLAGKNGVWWMSSQE